MKPPISPLLIIAAMLGSATGSSAHTLPVGEALLSSEELKAVDPRGRTDDAFYVSCSFVKNVPDGASQFPAIPMMFVIKTNSNRHLPPDDQPLTRSYAETFDVILDPRRIFSPTDEITFVDRRPIYVLLQWKDRGQDSALFLPYAGAARGLHSVPGILGRGSINFSLDAKDWKTMPGGTLSDTYRAKCRAYETMRGSVAMEKVQ
jgi:hypothetical protein